MVNKNILNVILYCKLHRYLWVMMMMQSLMLYAFQNFNKLSKASESVALQLHYLNNKMTELQCFRVVFRVIV